MSIWNKVLIGFIFVAAVAFAYLAMRTLRTHERWKVLADQHVNGAGGGQPGILWYQDKNDSSRGRIAKLELDVRELLANRDRVWTDCKPQHGPQTAQTGRVSVSADISGISPRAVLQVFETTTVQDGGRYLGEFRVVADQGGAGMLTMEPASKMNARELARLAESVSANSSWVLYETMPRDTHETFAHLQPEEIEQVMAAQSVSEYLNDGKMLTPEEVEAVGLSGRLIAVDEDTGRPIFVDQNGRTVFCSGVDDNGRLTYVDENEQFVCTASVEKNVESADSAPYSVIYLDENGQEMAGVTLAEKEVVDGKGKYVRPLNDYWVLVGESRRQYAMLAEEIGLAEEDLAKTQDALANDKKYIAFREREVESLSAEAKDLEGQRGLVHRVLARVEEETKALQESIGELISLNMLAARQLDEIQQQAKQAIDARTASIAP